MLQHVGMEQLDTSSRTAVSLANGTASAGVNLGLRLAAAPAPFTAVADATLTILTDGAVWQELSRKFP